LVLVLTGVIAPFRIPSKRQESKGALLISWFPFRMKAGDNLVSLLFVPSLKGRRILMNDQDLRSLLEQLHTEIERNEPLDEKERELLQHLELDIHELLAQSEGERIQAESTIIKRLEESIDYFEITYPDLTMLLNKLLSILSGAGI
jgi:hypothetical protein